MKNIKKFLSITIFLSLFFFLNSPVLAACSSRGVNLVITPQNPKVGDSMTAYVSGLAQQVDYGIRVVRENNIIAEGPRRVRSNTQGEIRLSFWADYAEYYTVQLFVPETGVEICGSNVEIKTSTTTTTATTPTSTGIPKPSSWLRSFSLSVLPTLPSNGWAYILQSIVPFIINLLLFLLILLSLIFLIWGGISWIMAGGNKEGMAKAKGTVTSAIIGLAIGLAAFIIVGLVFSLFNLELFSSGKSNSSNTSSPTQTCSQCITDCVNTTGQEVAQCRSSDCSSKCQTTPNPTTTIPITPPTPTPTPTTSTWPGTNWTANQTVPTRTWWNDMVKNGYISVDSTAQQVAGSQINSFIDGSNLVPNPVEYYKKSFSFSGNCEPYLKDLAGNSQGHIIVKKEAYDRIPGGTNCQIFANK